MSVKKLSESPIDKVKHVHFAQTIQESFHKMGAAVYNFLYYQKVIHRSEALILNEKKLYTILSTLSTIINYYCRMLKWVSISKMRFVTYDKLTKQARIISFWT